MHTLGLTAAVVLASLISVNAAFMIVSPKAWFHLPRWILLKGSLVEKKYAVGLGALEVRIAGAAVLGLVAWTLWDIFAK